MKKLLLLLPLLSFNSFAGEDKQDKNYSIGLGIGAMYSGVGANFSFVSETDLKYISAGCVEYSSITKATCGFALAHMISESGCRTPSACGPLPLIPDKPRCFTPWQSGQSAISPLSVWVFIASSNSQISWHSTGCSGPFPPQISQT